MIAIAIPPGLVGGISALICLGCAAIMQGKARQGKVMHGKELIE
jgi:hypothetical protein